MANEPYRHDAYVRDLEARCRDAEAERERLRQTLLYVRLSVSSALHQIDESLGLGADEGA